MLDCNLIIHKVYRVNKHNTLTYFTPTDSSLNKLNEFIKFIQSRESDIKGENILFIKWPTKLPTIIPPKKYAIEKGQIKVRWLLL